MVVVLWIGWLSVAATPQILETTRVQGLVHHDTFEDKHVTSSHNLKAENQIQSVAQVVADIPSVQLRQSGTLGSYASVSIRGLGGSNVLTVLGDLPLSSQWGGVSVLAASGFEAIRVFKSYATPQYGSPLGGVIQLMPYAPTDKPQLRVSAGYGSFATRTFTLQTSFKFKQWGVMLHNTYQGSSGAFKYFDDRGTLYNTHDDRYSVRRNNDYNGFQSLLVLEHNAWFDSTFKITTLTHFHVQGVAGTGERLMLHTRSHGIQHATRVGLYDMMLRSGKLTITPALDVSVASRTFLDPKQETGFSSARMTSQFVQVGADVKAVFSDAWRGMLTFVPRLSFEHYAQQGAGKSMAQSYATYTQHRLIQSIGLEDRIDAVYGIITPGLRIDRVSGAGEYSPSLQIFIPWLQHFYVRTLASRFHRLPSVLERYGDGAGVIASPHVKTEKGYTLDVATGYDAPIFNQRGHAHIEMAAYRTWAYDLIRILPVSPVALRATNQNTSHITGIEVQSQLDLWGVSSGLGYAYTRAVKPMHQGSKVLEHTPGIPEHRVMAHVAYRWFEHMLRYDLEAVSRMYLAGANQREIPTRVLHHVSARIALPFHLQCVANIQNITNQRNDTLILVQGYRTRARLSDFVGYPLPGRRFFMSLEWSL